MEFTDPVKLTDGRYFIKLGGKTVFQLNKCHISGGGFASKPLTFELSKEAHEKLKKVENIFVKEGITSSQKWFGQVIPDNKIEKAFRSVVDGTTAEIPLYTVKGDTMTTFWALDKSSKTIDSEWSTIDILVEAVGIRIAKKNFEPIFRIVQVKESSKPKNAEYLFEESDDDIEDYID
jgi:hypothetical protein